MKLCTLIRITLYEACGHVSSIYDVWQTHQNHPVRIRAAASVLVGNNVPMKLCTLIRITLYEACGHVSIIYDVWQTHQNHPV